MGKIFAIVGEWLLRNGVKKVLTGAGLGVFSYLAVVTAIRSAFDSLIGELDSLPRDVLQLMGIYGIDFVISAFVSVAVFLLTLNNGKLIIKQVSK
ncbi:DUF2523 family protein [Acinetobacter tianfuensis]|uniref:DUF2523 domain-containing protein n=1 Tax=Acinetobacter tianfuensis TaxID=2419603 RepID=A0A3A8E225_9GAMM|nr:DUF2523 family protein [Acinetobacter tianfuensis]RKG29057.1 DUF2523 domain-containing protein [Acinetobacter tianfuensis]